MKLSKGLSGDTEYYEYKNEQRYSGAQGCGFAAGIFLIAMILIGAATYIIQYFKY